MTMVRDDYPKYFAEKLWEWLPPVYRELDHLEGGDALRALIEALAQQAALLKRSQDRLWDDAFVELASDWAVPYIAEMLGTRLVSSLNPRARRADVAKTIYYRRRKGTLSVLEQLIADMTGWDGKVVEEFRRLARARHGLDGPALAGPVTGTPEGGLAEFRQHRGAELTGGPFDEFHYTPDLRKPKGDLGRRGIPKLTFHLYRLQAVEFYGVQPRRMNIKPLASAPPCFTFDPSGRDIPLFCPNHPGLDWSAWHSAPEWALPRAMTCCLLAEAVYQIGAREVAWVLNEGAGGAPIATLAQRRDAAADLRRLAGQRFRSGAQLHHVLAGMASGATLTQAGVLVGLMSLALVEDCGSSALLPGEDGLSSMGAPALDLTFHGTALPISRKRTRAGRLETWNVDLLTGADWVVHPERGRFMVHLGSNSLASIRVHYQVGMLAPIGAGAYGRELPGGLPSVTWQDGVSSAGAISSGVVQVMDSATYSDPPDFTAVRDCTLQAAEEQRPYLKLNNFWRFTSDAPGAELTLDGLWIGTWSAARSVVLATSGTHDFAQVTLRACTLDPGGEDAGGAELPPVSLIIEGHVGTLVVDQCVLSSIQLKNASSSVDHLVLRDSMIHARLPGTIPLQLPACHLEMQRCTVLGPSLDALTIVVERLEASDVLVAGLVQVSDTQSGCFRFSARTQASIVPHPYRSAMVDDLPRLFASRRFGDPHYLNLSQTAPKEISRGAENGREMGCFAGADLPVKEDSLRAKIEEFMPFGRLPNLLIEN